MATKTPPVTLDAIRAQLREIAEERHEWERTASPSQRLFFLQLSITQMGLDYARALREIARLNAELDTPVYVGAMGMHEFHNEEEARAFWDIIQCLLSPLSWAEWKASPKLHKPFPPDKAIQNRQRQRETNRKAFVARLEQERVRAHLDQSRQGSVDENLLQ